MSWEGEPRPYAERSSEPSSTRHCCAGDKDEIGRRSVVVAAAAPLRGSQFPSEAVAQLNRCWRGLHLRAQGRRSGRRDSLSYRMLTGLTTIRGNSGQFRVRLRPATKRRLSDCSTGESSSTTRRPNRAGGKGHARPPSARESEGSSWSPLTCFNDQACKVQTSAPCRPCRLPPRDLAPATGAQTRASPLTTGWRRDRARPSSRTRHNPLLQARPRALAVSLL